MKKFTNFFEFVRNHFLSCFDVSFNALLFLIYKFDFWHVLATPYRRRYKMAVRKYLSLQKDFQVIDIGCGLGDNVRGIDGAIGLDRSLNVIRAAKKKNSKISYFLYEFGKDRLGEILEGVQTSRPKLFLGLNFLQKSNFKDFIFEIKQSSSNNDDLLILDFIQENFAKDERFAWMPQLEQLANAPFDTIICNDKYREINIFRVRDLNAHAN